MLYADAESSFDCEFYESTNVRQPLSIFVNWTVNFLLKMTTFSVDCTLSPYIIALVIFLLLFMHVPDGDVGESLKRWCYIVVNQSILNSI